MEEAGFEFLDQDQRGRSLSYDRLPAVDSLGISDELKDKLKTLILSSSSPWAGCWAKVCGAEQGLA